MPPVGPAPAPKGAPKPAPVPAPKPGIDINELIKLDPSILRSMADIADRKAGKVPPVVVADPVAAAAAAEEAKKKLDEELQGKRDAAKKVEEAEEKENKSSRRKWMLFKFLLIILVPYLAWTLGSIAARRGMQASLVVGQTTVPLMPSYPNLTNDLDAANERIKVLMQDKEELEASHRTALADVRLELRTKVTELDDALSKLTIAELNSSTRMVEAAQRQRDRAIEARNVALADVAEITSQMSSMASVHSSTIAQLHSEHALAISSMESRLNQAKTRELAAKDATIAQLQSVVQSQRLDIQNLQFAGNGNVVQANGLVDFEILTPTQRAGHQFQVRFEQRRELVVDVTVVRQPDNDHRIPTSKIVQLPPGLWTVTRIESGQPFGRPVDVLIMPGRTTRYYRFGTEDYHRETPRPNPFMAFWNGVGSSSVTVPDGRIQRHEDGRMILVENSRIVTQRP